MILAILILALILAFIFIVIPIMKGSKWLGTFFLLIVIGCTGAIIANDSFHWGMKKQTETQTYRLVSSAGKQSSVNMLLYQGLGNGSEKVYVYNTTNDNKRQIMKTTKSSAKVKHTNGEAMLRLKTTRYVYKNNAYKLMFNTIMHNDRRVQHRTYEFMLPDSWYVLSTAQAKKLAKAVQQDPTGMQMAIAQRTKQLVMKSMMKNPTMSADQQQKLTTQATKQATLEYINNLK